MSNENNYIDLKTLNGRLFPIWVLDNFKKYKLQPIIYDSKEDPCLEINKNNNTKENLKQLRLHQKFLTSFFDYRSPFKDVLIYHDVGSGKTASAINIYNILYNYSPLWNVFILIKAALKDDPWLKELKEWILPNDKEDRMANIKFIHYDAPNADKTFLNAIKEADITKKNLYIIDEAHNFINNVYNNIVSGYGKRAHVIYEHIISEKKENKQTRVILLSGTPTMNNPYELALIFNLLRLDIFPKTETKFNEVYISQNTLNQENKNMFQRRIMGLVSYYIGSDPQTYAKKYEKVKLLEMDPLHEKVYNYFENIEKKLNKKRYISKSSKSVYNVYTRQSSNFVFPFMGGKFDGESRPKLHNYKLVNNDINNIEDIDDIDYIEKKDTEKDTEKEKEKEKNKKAYKLATEEYIQKFKEYLTKLYNKEELDRDIEIFKTQYSMKFINFWKNYKDKCELLKAMYSSSCKMTAILFYMMRSKGPVLIYSNFVLMEGLEIFKIYLDFFGYSNFNNKDESYDYYRYVEFNGNIDKEQRKKNLSEFNNKDNVYGSKIKVILISPAGAEGINLMNVRQVHIMEPYWNEVRNIQLIGRAVRFCSHKNLPLKERFVDIYRYHAIRTNKEETTDERIYKLAQNKYTLIDSFLQTIREVAIDCELFKNHNMIDKKYECFKFNESSLFNKFIAPVYKDNIIQDKKLDNGLNSKNTEKKQIKVYKIKAIIKENINNVKEYWYNPHTGIVYDLEFNYPIGKVYFENGMPEKYDKDIYIINELIPIPKLLKT
jgi:superfamily II DNA or RNA helicase